MGSVSTSIRGVRFALYILGGNEWVSVPTSLGEWIHSPWFDLGLVVWKGYRPRVRLVLAGGHAFCVDFAFLAWGLHREPKGTKRVLIEGHPTWSGRAKHSYGHLLFH